MLSLLIVGLFAAQAAHSGDPCRLRVELAEIESEEPSAPHRLLRAVYEDPTACAAAVGAEPEVPGWLSLEPDVSIFQMLVTNSSAGPLRFGNQGYYMRPLGAPRAKPYSLRAVSRLQGGAYVDFRVAIRDDGSWDLEQ